MANAKAIISNRFDAIRDRLIGVAEKTLARSIKLKLIEKIESNFYNRYDVGDSGWLVDSLNIECNLIGSVLKIFVYFDNRELAHTSWWGSDRLGVASGSYVYTPQWINNGWTFDPYTGKRMMENGLGVHFLEDAVRELEIDRNWIDDFYRSLRKSGIKI